MTHQTELAVAITLVIVLVTMTLTSESVQATDNNSFISNMFE